MKDQRKEVQAPTNQITIQNLIDTHNIAMGTKRVLDESLVPGHLSMELHNSRMQNHEVINAIAFQIEQMRELGKVKNIKNTPQKQKKSLKRS